MSKRAEHARSLLGSIEAKTLEARARAEPWAALKLTRAEARFLAAACRAALDGASDPFGLGRQAGGQQLADGGFGEALLVHQRKRALGTLRAACESVGAELHRDGSKSGAVEKNYKAHRSALEATERFYQALDRREAPAADDVAAILAGKARGK